MAEPVNKGRRMEDAVKQALQDELLGSLQGDARFDNGVSASLAAPTRRSIQSAGVAPPSAPGLPRPETNAAAKPASAPSSV